MFSGMDMSEYALLVICWALIFIQYIVRITV